MGTRLATKKLNMTKDYRLFSRSVENRALKPKLHKRLYKSMKSYGFLSGFPIVCWRDAKGHLIVKDGQHRLAFAEELGLPVWWVEEEVDFDIAKINSTSTVWKPRDYAEKFAAQGNPDYQEGLEFADIHGLAVGTAFTLLVGTTSWSNVSNDFYAGEFKVKDRKWADAVASVYGPILRMSPVTRNARFVQACMAVCRVEGFDADRLIRGAERCRDKLLAYSTRDAYLTMMEEIYNFGRKSLVGLKAAAIMAMRERSATNGANVNHGTKGQQSPLGA